MSNNNNPQGPILFELSTMPAVMATPEVAIATIAIANQAMALQVKMAMAPTVKLAMTLEVKMAMDQEVKVAMVTTAKAQVVMVVPVT